MRRFTFRFYRFFYTAFALPTDRSTIIISHVIAPLPKITQCLHYANYPMGRESREILTLGEGHRCWYARCGSNAGTVTMSATNGFLWYLIVVTLKAISVINPTIIIGVSYRELPLPGVIQDKELDLMGDSRNPAELGFYSEENETVVKGVVIPSGIVLATDAEKSEYIVPLRDSECSWNDIEEKLALNRKIISEELHNAGLIESGGSKKTKGHAKTKEPQETAYYPRFSLLTSPMPLTCRRRNSGTSRCPSTQ